MKKVFIIFVLTLVPMLASADAVEIDGIYYNLISKGKIAEVTSNPNKYSGEVVIPASVTYEEVEYSVTNIGGHAFDSCRGLTSITIPNSVTNIGAWAFNICPGLTSITIPNGMTSIDSGVFWGCTGLTAINIPNSVTSIGNYAFAHCSGLTSVTIPNSVTSIGDYAFDECSNLTSVIIPNSVTSIGSYAFGGCSGLTSVTIPNSVTSIRVGSFQGCSGLTSITIPNSVTRIGVYAFSDCQELADVYCYAENVPSTNSDAFKDSHIEYATLHVPDASLQAYRDTDPWSGFGTIVSIGGSGIPKCATPSISYSDMKLSFSCETEGVDFISKMKDSDINDFYTNEINLTATYEISVYATKTGYENSDVATATLVWSNASFTETTPATAIEYVQESAALPVLIQNNGGTLTIQGAADGTPICVYTVAGIQAGTAVSQNSRATISTSMQQGDIAIIKIGERSVKIALK